MRVLWRSASSTRSGQEWETGRSQTEQCCVDCRLSRAWLKVVAVDVSDDKDILEELSEDEADDLRDALVEDLPGGNEFGADWALWTGEDDKGCGGLGGEELGVLHGDGEAGREVGGVLTSDTIGDLMNLLIFGKY